MRSGTRFFFIVDRGIAMRMDRVIALNRGRTIGKESGPEGMAYEVEKI